MLPFVVEPTKAYEEVLVGSEEIGILKFPKYKGLTPTERGFIKEQNLFNYTKSLAELAKRVSREHGAKFSYVNDRINAYVFGGVIEGDTVKVSTDGKEGKVTAVEYDKDFKIKSFTADIDEKEVELTLEEIELVNPEWYAPTYEDIQSLTTEFLESLDTKNIVYATAVIRFRLAPEWTIKQTIDPNVIKPELVTKIAEFAYKEQNGWEEAKPEAPKPSTEEELGKSLTAATK
jgi:hypothetical protein